MMMKSDGTMENPKKKGMSTTITNSSSSSGDLRSKLQLLKMKLHKDVSTDTKGTSETSLDQNQHVQVVVNKKYERESSSVNLSKSKLQTSNNLEASVVKPQNHPSALLTTETSTSVKTHQLEDIKSEIEISSPYDDRSQVFFDQSIQSAYQDSPDIPIDDVQYEYSYDTSEQPASELSDINFNLSNSEDFSYLANSGGAQDQTQSNEQSVTNEEKPDEDTTEYLQYNEEIPYEYDSNGVEYYAEYAEPYSTTTVPSSIDWGEYEEQAQEQEEAYQYGDQYDSKYDNKYGDQYDDNYHYQEDQQQQQQSYYNEGNMEEYQAYEMTDERTATTTAAAEEEENGSNVHYDYYANYPEDINNNNDAVNYDYGNQQYPLDSTYQYDDDDAYHEQNQTLSINEPMIQYPYDEAQYQQQQYNTLDTNIHSHSLPPTATATTRPPSGNLIHSKHTNHNNNNNNRISTHLHQSSASTSPQNRFQNTTRNNAASIIQQQQQQQQFASSASESEDEMKQKRHLQIWGKFFENATVAYNTKTGSTIDISSDSEEEENAVPRSKPSMKPVDYHSPVGKTYFTTAIAMEQSWPLLISSKKYQTLISSAKENIGASNYILPNLALFAAVIKEDIDTLNSFFLRGMNPNVIDEHDRNLAHHAARIGNEEVLAVLVDNDCDMDKQDKEGYTPLHIAILFNRLSAIRFLLDCAVDVMNKCNHDGYHALQIAQQRQQQHPECYDLLKDFLAYANITSQDIPDGNHHSSPNLTKDISSSSAASSLVTKKLSKKAEAGVDNLRKRALLNRKVDFHISPQKPPSNNEQQQQELKASTFSDKQTTPSRSSSMETEVQIQELTNDPPIVKMQSTGEKKGKQIEKEEEEEEEEEESTTMSNNAVDNLIEVLAAYVWGLAISLINISIGMLTGSSYSSNRNHLHSSDTADDQTEESTKRWSNRNAPPTDSELSQIGLGFTTNRIVPPNDVQIAIAMSKVGRKLIDSSNPDSPISPPKTSNNNENNVTSPPSNPVSFSRPPPIQSNSYSLGKNLPQGVSWRYVNILDENSQNGNP